MVAVAGRVTLPAKNDRELVRRRILYELSSLFSEYGSAVVSQVLLNSPRKEVLQATRRWYELGDGDLFRVLGKGGVRINRKGREFEISDGAGSFKFTDDFYYSGFNYLMSGFSKFFRMPVEFLSSERFPNSLRSRMEKAGCWDEASPVKAARDYLIRLHEAGLYGGDLVLRMLGGDFTNFRKVVFRGSNVMGPVITPYAKAARGFKVIDLCIDGKGFDELWPELMWCIRVTPTEDLMKAFKVGDPIKKKEIDRFWNAIKKELIRQKDPDWFRTAAAGFHLAMKDYGANEANLMLVGFCFCKRQEIARCFFPL